MTELVHDPSMAVDVILRDGTTLRLRRSGRRRRPGARRFLRRTLGAERFLRFHGLALAGDRFVRTLVDPDWAERGALIGVMGDGGEERIVAVANYVRLRDPHAPRSRSRSRTTPGARGSGRACSSSSRRAPRRRVSRRSSPR